MPHWQLQPQHATDDPELLRFCDKTHLAGHVHHVGHINIDRFSVQQSWKNFLQTEKEAEEQKSE